MSTISTHKPSNPLNYKSGGCSKGKSKAEEISPRTTIPIPNDSYIVNNLNSNNGVPFSRNFVMDYMWNAHQTKQNLHISANYPPLPFLKDNRDSDTSLYPSSLATVSSNLRVFYSNSAFKPVTHNVGQLRENDQYCNESDDDVDIETTEEDSILESNRIYRSCENLCNDLENKIIESPINVYRDDYESNTSSTIEVEISPIWDKVQDDTDPKIKKEEVCFLCGFNIIAEYD